MEIVPPIKEKNSSRGLILIGNGPAFLQVVLMLNGRDVLAVTNNDADYLNLQYFGLKKVMKTEFNNNGLAHLSHLPQDTILVTSESFGCNILKSLNSFVREDQIIVIRRYPKMKKDFSHLYTYVIDTEDQFDKDLWYRLQALNRLAKMQIFIQQKKKKIGKTLKVGMFFFGPPDPDAIASGLAFIKLFSMESQTDFIATDKVRRFENRALLSYLKAKVIDVSSVQSSDYQLRICVDAQPSFFKKSGFNIDFDICIDHHPLTETNSSVKFLDVRKNHGACSTILAQYFYYSKKNIPKTLATALLSGMKTDTNNFTRNVNKPDIHILNYLYDKADKNILRKLDFALIPWRALKYYKRAYNRYVFESPFLYCHLGKVNYPDIGSILAEYFLKIQRVQLSLVSCITAGRLTIYIRSINEDYNSGEIAQQLFKGFGVGGGHFEMGRAESEIGDLPYESKNIEKKVLEKVKEYISSHTLKKRKNN